jgi:RNA polymerase sigma factor (sigma-70 family)
MGPTIFQSGPSQSAGGGGPADANALVVEPRRRWSNLHQIGRLEDMVAGADADERLAEDVTQEVFVFLWQFPTRFDAGRGSLRAWLGLLAHHRSVDRVRAENRHTQREMQTERSELLADNIHSDLTAEWLADRVRCALELLPADQREAVVLAYFGERSYRQVALELGIPEGTVKSRVRLALRRLNTLLSSDFSGQDAPAWT